MLEKLEEYKTIYTTEVKKLVDVHKEKNQYHFKYRDKHYDLLSFLYAANTKYSEWYQKLNDAVTYNSDFAGELDHKKSFFCAWCNKLHHINDKNLITLLDDCYLLHEKAFKLGGKIMAAEPDKRKSLLRRIESRYVKKIERSFNKLLEHVEPKIQVFKKQEAESLTAMFKISEKMSLNLEGLKKFIDAEMAETQESVDRAKNFAIVFLTTLGFIAIMISTILTIIVTRSITKPLDIVVDGLRIIGEGNLTKKMEITQNDEFGELAERFNEFVNSWRDIINNIMSVSNQVASGSGEMSTTARQMSISAGELASISNETADAISEMNRNSEEVLKSTETQTSAIVETSSSVEEMSCNIQGV